MERIDIDTKENEDETYAESGSNNSIDSINNDVLNDNFDLGELGEPHLLDQNNDDEEPSVSTVQTTNEEDVSLAWNPRNNFTADSPYFKSFCDHEVQSLSLLTDAMREITSRTKTFCKTGALMAEATRRLASSCRLRWDDEQKSEEGLSQEAIDKIVEARRKAVGGEMAELLEHLGEVSTTVTDLLFIADSHEIFPRLWTKLLSIKCQCFNQSKAV